MKAGYSDTRAPPFIGIVFLLFGIVAEFAAIMALNDGVLVYTLDDPYLHMALAENLKNGHYGVNAGEFSAPSSSVLWPFILAPFSSLEYVPLLINTVAATSTVFVFAKVLQTSIPLDDRRAQSILVSSLLIVLILATNTIGLVFTGMEHSLQVLLVSAMAYGLILEVERGKVEPWLLCAIAVAPLIRYENLAVSTAALGYLALRRHFRHAAPVFGLMVLLLLGFSCFLALVGLDPLPTPVAAKSALVGGGSRMEAIVGNIKTTLTNRQGVILVFGVLVLLSQMLFSLSGKKAQLALAAMFAVLLHCVAGSYGWYHRLEIYIWSFFLLLFLYCTGARIAGVLGRGERRGGLVKMVAVAAGFGAFAGVPYIADLFTVPAASNNIYEQQYQMHRFAVDYYKKPVAVNDLGYVSYKNDSHVLDLWGMGSPGAFEHRLARNGPEWMSQMAEDHHVELAMIYEGWFRDIPDEWIKIGELHLGRERVTPARSTVSFFALDRNAYRDLVEKLQLFRRTLPPGVEFTLAGNGG